MAKAKSGKKLYERVERVAQALVGREEGRADAQAKRGEAKPLGEGGCEEAGPEVGGWRFALVCREKGANEA